MTQELVRARRRLLQRNLPGGETSEDQGEQNLTLVMIIIIVIFVVCQSPAFANQLLYYLIGDEQYACGKVSHSCPVYTHLLVHGQVTTIFVVSVCLFVQSFSQPSLIRFRSN